MNIIQILIRSNVGTEVKESKSFSVLMDTTTDVSSFDQCVIVLRNIVLRYILETVIRERIMGLKYN